MGDIMNVAIQLLNIVKVKIEGATTADLIITYIFLLAIFLSILYISSGSSFLRRGS